MFDRTNPIKAWAEEAGKILMPSMERAQMYVLSANDHKERQLRCDELNKAAMEAICSI